MGEARTQQYEWHDARPSRFDNRVVGSRIDYNKYWAILDVNADGSGQVAVYTIEPTDVWVPERPGSPNRSWSPVAIKDFYYGSVDEAKEKLPDAADELVNSLL